MPSKIELGEITLDVVRKDIKNVHLSVYPPAGRVKIAAPLRMSLDTIRLFAIAKLGWIKQQQKILRAQERESPREFLDRESHYVWGRRYLLRLVEEEGAPRVELHPSRLVLRVRPGTAPSAREAVVSAWYRQLLKVEVPTLITTWEPRLGVAVEKFYVQRMKTRWGSCNVTARTIRLNTELAKKPRECLEYIVVHEMVHLLERNHGPRFVALMNRFSPNWRSTRDLLNGLPARHEQWEY
ncbi:MAG TPA: SprT family zinc-dependent metalloprotease [Thermoanaerobaculia bacterium]|jgi:predicted metal-dependent hydrolase|nr:SprT family zinc-dependent metalloprotease [Thermoanaerobaculia bacterium]